MNQGFPYEGPAPVFLSEIDPDTGEILIIPIQPTPPGGEPYLGIDYKADQTEEPFLDPPFNQTLDTQAVESGIFDVKTEGFVQQWEGPWIPNTEYGVPMDTPLAGGHAAAVVFDPLSEYGHMRDPSSLPAHWEVDESPNEYWRMGQDMRFGGKPLGGANPQAILYDDIQDQSDTAYQLSWIPYRNYGGGRHNAVVAFPKVGSNIGNQAAVQQVTALNDILPATTDVY